MGHPLVTLYGTNTAEPCRGSFAALRMTLQEQQQEQRQNQDTTDKTNSNGKVNHPTLRQRMAEGWGTRAARVREMAICHAEATIFCYLLDEIT